MQEYKRKNSLKNYCEYSQHYFDKKYPVFTVNNKKTVDKIIDIYDILIFEQKVPVIITSILCYGKSLRKVLKGSPFLVDGQQSRSLPLEEYKKYQNTHDHMITDFTIENVLHHNKIKHLNKDVDITKLIKIKGKKFKRDELKKTLTSLGYTSREIDVILFAIHIDNNEFNKKNINILNDKGKSIGTLMNTAKQDTIKIEDLEFEKDNIRDMLYIMVREDTIHIFIKIIEKISRKLNSFDITGLYYEDKNNKRETFSEITDKTIKRLENKLNTNKLKPLLGKKFKLQELANNLYYKRGFRKKEIDEIIAFSSLSTTEYILDFKKLTECLS